MKNEIETSRFGRNQLKRKKKKDIEVIIFDDTEQDDSKDIG